MSTIHKTKLIAMVSFMVFVMAGLYTAQATAHRYATNAKGAVMGYACTNNDKLAANGCGQSNQLGYKDTATKAWADSMAPEAIAAGNAAHERWNAGNRLKLYNSCMELLSEDGIEDLDKVCKNAR